MLVQITKVTSKHSWYKNRIGSVYNVRKWFFNYMISGTKKTIKASDCTEIDTKTIDILI